LEPDPTEPQSVQVQFQSEIIFFGNVGNIFFIVTFENISCGSFSSLDHEMYLNPQENFHYFSNAQDA
jgi:hypothetical protein